MQFVTMTLTTSALLLLSIAGLSSAGFAASDSLQHAEHEYQEHKHESAKPYNFGYGVVSHKHGVEFGQQENSDGHTVTGHYKVKLPDGRTQVVTYTADWNKGYNAHVQYEGHAAHPQTYQQSHQQVYQHEEVPLSQEHASLSEGASLGGAGYAAGESYGLQESQGQSEHSSGY